mgnify:CR=1 FL=1
MTEPRRYLYDNIRVLAPDGTHLSFIPRTRADWYVRKELAKWEGAKQLRLNFEPKGRTNVSSWYLVEHKNRCVVCGEEEVHLLQKHHVVPVCLRTWMAPELKEHRSFDVLMICELCHREYEVEAELLKRDLAEEAGLEWLGSTKKWKECEARSIVIKQAKNLLAGTVHERAAEKLKRNVEAVLGSIPGEEALAEFGARLKKDRRDLMAGFYGSLVEAHKPSAGLIVRWRRHFVEMMEPGFLEPEWLADIEVVK